MAMTISVTVVKEKKHVERKKLGYIIFVKVRKQVPKMIIWIYVFLLSLKIDHIDTFFL